MKINIEDPIYRARTHDATSGEIRCPDEGLCHRSCVVGTLCPRVENSGALSSSKSFNEDWSPKPGGPLFDGRLLDLMESAKKHTYRAAWQKASPNDYNSAKRWGVFDKATAHMPARMLPKAVDVPLSRDMDDLPDQLKEQIEINRLVTRGARRCARDMGHLLHLVEPDHPERKKFADRYRMWRETFWDTQNYRDELHATIEKLENRLEGTISQLKELGHEENF